ncbi:hypothetical protein V8E55_008752 [Tylopilus felleus]
MTLLSLFMTSTGIFCFVPISQRLIESGIIPASNRWRFRKLPSVLAPTFYARKEERIQFLLASDKSRNAWSDDEERHQIQSPLPHIPLYSVDDTFTTDQQLPVPCTDSEWIIGVTSPQCSPTSSLLQSTSSDTFYGRESASFVSDSTLCDHCNTLLQREIPPDHIPSVIRALELFEARDRLSDVVFNECEVVALTNAFSMLRL